MKPALKWWYAGAVALGQLRTRRVRWATAPRAGRLLVVDIPDSSLALVFTASRHPNYPAEVTLPFARESRSPMAVEAFLDQFSGLIYNKFDMKS
jgi:hypothetical protein